MALAHRLEGTTARCSHLMVPILFRTVLLLKSLEYVGIDGIRIIRWPVQKISPAVEILCVPLDTPTSTTTLRKSTESRQNEVVSGPESTRSYWKAAMWRCHAMSKIQGDAQGLWCAMFENGPDFNVRSQSIQPKSRSHSTHSPSRILTLRVVIVKLAIWFKNHLTNVWLSELSILSFDAVRPYGPMCSVFFFDSSTETYKHLNCHCAYYATSQAVNLSIPRWLVIHFWVRDVAVLSQLCSNERRCHKRACPESVPCGWTYWTKKTLANDVDVDRIRSIFVSKIFQNLPKQVTPSVWA